MPVEVNAGIDYLQKVFGAVVAHPKGVDRVGLREEVVQQLSRERRYELGNVTVSDEEIARGANFFTENGIFDELDGGRLALSAIVRRTLVYFCVGDRLRKESIRLNE